MRARLVELDGTVGEEVFGGGGGGDLGAAAGEAGRVREEEAQGAAQRGAGRVGAGLDEEGDVGAFLGGGEGRVGGGVAGGEAAAGGEGGGG